MLQHGKDMLALQRFWREIITFAEVMNLSSPHIEAGTTLFML